MANVVKSSAALTRRARAASIGNDTPGVDGKARSFIHQVANDDIPLKMDVAQVFWNTTRQAIEREKGDICDIQQHEDIIGRLCRNHGYTSSEKVWNRLAPLYVNAIRQLKNPSKTQNGIPIDYKQNEPFDALGQSVSSQGPTRSKTTKGTRKKGKSKRENFDKISVLEPILLKMDPNVRATRAKWENRSTSEQATIYYLPKFDAQIVAINNNDYAVLVCKGMRPYKSFHKLSYADVKNEEFVRPVSARHVNRFQEHLVNLIRTPKDNMPPREENEDWHDKFNATVSLLRGLQNHPEGIPVDRQIYFSAYFALHSTPFPEGAIAIASATRGGLDSALKRGSIKGFPDQAKTMHTASQWLIEKDNTPG